MENKVKEKFLVIEETKEFGKNVKPSSYLELFFAEGLQNDRFNILGEFETINQATELLREYHHNAEYDSYSKTIDVTIYYIDCRRWNDDIEDYESYGYETLNGAVPVFTDDYFELSTGRRIAEKDFADISIDDFFNNKEYALNLIEAILAENNTKELIIELSDGRVAAEMTFLKDDSEGYSIKLTANSQKPAEELLEKMAKYLQEDEDDYVYKMLYENLVIND